MYAETPRKILLAGTLGEAEVSSLEIYCRQLQKYGQTELLVDLEGVLGCDRAGLRGLLALSGHTGIAVSIEGARWSQFMDLLSRVPIAEVPRLCDDVRSIVGRTGRVRADVAREATSRVARNSPGRLGFSSA